MGLDKINWKPLERIYYSRCHWENLWSMGRGQNININRNLEETDSNLHGSLCDVQEFSGGSRVVDV